MERNFYDMTAVTGKAVNDAKRIQAQTAEYLSNYNTQLKESLQAEEDRKMNAAMAGARFGHAANIARSNARINKLNEEIRYTNTSSVIGMTEMVAQVVEAGLLLDESELVKIYPEYKEEIRNIVKGFLQEGQLNSSITKKETLQLMEYVAAKLPSVKEGVSLTEDELSNYMAINKPLDIDRSIRNLGGDVASRVATLMEKEQKKAEQIEKDVKRAKAKEAKAAAKDEVSAEDLIAELENGNISEADLEEMLKNGEISQNTYDEVIGVYEDAANGKIEAAENEEGQPPVEGEVPSEGAPVTTSAEAPAEEEEGPTAQGMDPTMAGQDPAMMAGAEGGMAPAVGGAMPSADSNAAMGGSVPSGMPKKQVQMLPDGTMNINIYENSFSLVRETPRCGLIESLAVNEANTMLNEGKQYDGDLCLSKAIIYVTITEAMDHLGLMNVNERTYANIISAAGGILNEKSTHVTYEGMRKTGQTQTREYKTNKSNKSRPMKVTKSDGSVVYKDSKGKEVSEERFNELNKKADEMLTESILVNQYVPKRNDVYSSDSLAERIRKKRLNEQQNLNE